MQILIYSNLTGVYPSALNEALKAALGSNLISLDTAWDGESGEALVRAEDAAVPANVQAVVQEHYTLNLAADQQVIDADGVDQAAITVPLADSNFDYVIWKADEVVSSGSGAVVSGVAQVNFSTDEAAEYLIEIKRQSPNYHSGYIAITAQEA